VFFVAGDPQTFYKFAGLARTKISDDLGLIPTKVGFDLCWIVDFPMYDWNEEEKKIDFSHNPFSMPNMPAEEFIALDAADRIGFSGIKAIQYDIVCNGVELSSGAIRNHRPDVMKKPSPSPAMTRACWKKDSAACCTRCRSARRRTAALRPGIDRIVMLLCGEENLREVVLFPMNQRAEDLMMGAPSEATPKQLRELHIRVVKPTAG
jgi:aspartyl-tRNA synthetase